MGSVPSFVPNIGPDGLATDVPIISYTEKVLEEKELKLKQYIQDNYSKIRNVEKELATLALEVKLTAGPKKHALEHLRKLIELSTEKIKAAKLKEEQAKKVWEAAEKAVKAEEANKERLCEDLNRLVQESAAAQYTRLEDLTRRIEALNPPENSNTDPSPQSVAADGQQSAPTDHGTGVAVDQSKSTKPADSSGSSAASSVVPSSTSTSTSSSDSDITVRHVSGRGQHVTIGRGRGRSSGGRMRGALMLQGSKPSEASGWTGAGFNNAYDEN